MTKKLPVIIVSLVGLLLVVAGVIVWQKSAVKEPSKTTAPKTPTIKKVDLKSQPEWVQKLTVTVKKGKSSTNSLDTLTFAVSGLPEGLVSSLEYTFSYETTNRGTDGGFSTRPIDINGETTYTKTVEMGSCSTGGKCVRNEGTTSVDLEFDFTTKDGDQPIWTGTLDLK
ncbi:MAG: hypothetical protein UY21_C0010G0018 [Microgenomates group bacterium GW2011_GWA1_48_10]|nr:MAG: hypothetical protein UY21_C0010G0018 [Microgenomates group bacterium GW2011_GWA1_48_10]OHA94345.1 MAG: hypothetical protein A3B88_04515 [Candidatus Zambryskibacteria bacterium RIFCSPHIGHO2_02_FULL_39_19]